MMRTLHSVLGSWWRDVTGHTGVVLGGTVSQLPPLSRRDARLLREELCGAVYANRFQFRIIFAMAILLVVATVVVPLLATSVPRGPAGGVLGCLTIAMMMVLIRLWREQTALEMMIVVATYVQGDALAELVTVLRERLKPWGMEDLQAFLQEHPLTELPRPGLDAGNAKRTPSLRGPGKESA